MSNHNSTEFLFAYDISDNRERRKVEKLLMGYGFRRQLSVFICRLTRSDKTRLLQQLKELNLSTGFIIIVRLAHNCHAETIGNCTIANLDCQYAYVV